MGNLFTFGCYNVALLTKFLLKVLDLAFKSIVFSLFLDDFEWSLDL